MLLPKDFLDTTVNKILTEGIKCGVEGKEMYFLPTIILNGKYNEDKERDSYQKRILLNAIIEPVIKEFNDYYSILRRMYSDPAFFWEEWYKFLSIRLIGSL